MLTSSKDEMIFHGSIDMDPSPQQPKGSTQWETLELYLVRTAAILFKLFELKCSSFCSYFPIDARGALFH